MTSSVLSSSGSLKGLFRMVIPRSHLGVMAAAMLLAGCSWLNSTADSVWSSLSGDDVSAAASRQADETGGSVIPIPPAVAESNPLPTLNPRPVAPTIGTGNFTATSLTPGSPTGTYVGTKVQALRGDLQQLQDNINRHNAELQQIRQGMAQDAATYYSLVGTINSRLQVGTTPGNPELVAQWNQSQAALDRMTADVAKLSGLSHQTAAGSSVATYLLESVKAVYGLQGAVDEDHRQLGLLDSEINRTLVPIDQLSNAISDDISRQSNYVSTERWNLVTLSLSVRNGELYGQSLAANTITAAPGAPRRPPSATALAKIIDRRPLVIIRFYRPKVRYEKPLYTAVRRALERRPNVVFDLVAVAPQQGDPSQLTLHSEASKRNAESVFRSLTSMGLAADRVSLSATTNAIAQSDEVRLYVR
jgi:hypothetical protein